MQEFNFGGGTFRLGEAVEVVIEHYDEDEGDTYTETITGHILIEKLPDTAIRKGPTQVYISGNHGMIGNRPHRTYGIRDHYLIGTIQMRKIPTGFAQAMAMNNHERTQIEEIPSLISDNVVEIMKDQQTPPMFFGEKPIINSWQKREIKIKE
jgi:hypothetical protein